VALARWCLHDLDLIFGVGVIGNRDGPLTLVSRLTLDFDGSLLVLIPASATLCLLTVKCLILEASNELGEFRWTELLLRGLFEKQRLWDDAKGLERL
jgi:hypothetical protein